ncbi:carbohydrate kinase family protein [Uliginosibacterium gangwonense]|uniref:carbohydrate kinase family protein n=1 Tax=Uliginosibacterium gangwonense TaxID=392736 RepID=UPI00037553E0|nr:carbohydrate kinase family protein [Uliginosibacterium gangwonense]
MSTTRSGVICGGCWLVDHNNSIAHWPEEETLANILTRTTDGGGPAHNMAIDLARLGATFPLWAMGAVGADDAGRFLQASCHQHGIDASRLRVIENVATSHTDVMTVASSGKRTFFHHQGANAHLSPDDFDFSDIPARILHLGAPGIHARMDAPWQEEANGWVGVLKRARNQGIWTNLEMISAEPAEIRHLVGPCLPHLDSLIINDYEAGALSGINIVCGGLTDVAAARRAALNLLGAASLQCVVIHYPTGCVAASRGESNVIIHPSVQVPPEAIVGANGAGDAFAAGVLYGLHEKWPLHEGLELGLAAAASALRSVSTTGAVATVEECKGLIRRWGWRAVS